MDMVRKDDITRLFCYLQIPQFHQAHIEELRGKCLTWYTLSYHINPALYMSYPLSSLDHSWVMFCSCASAAILGKQVDVLWQMSMSLSRINNPISGRIQTVLNGILENEN